MGQRLGVTQLCINTACVYLRRFYCMTDLKRFNKHLAASMCLFLAAKVEEQPRKLEHLIQTKLKLIPTQPKTNYHDKQREVSRAQEVTAQAEEGKLMENTLLKLLGFDLQINHPHTYVVRGCQMLKASKDFAQTAYFLATNSLHLTNMCVMYKSSAVACVCIHLAAKWARYQIPQSIEGKDWYNYIAADLDKDTLMRMAGELMMTFEQCPDSLKKTFRTAGSRVERNMTAGPDGAEPDKKRRRIEAPSATVTSVTEPAAGPSGVTAQRHPQSSAPVATDARGRPHLDPNTQQQVARSHAESSRGHHQHSQAHQRPGTNHRPGDGRPVSGRESIAAAPGVKMEPVQLTAASTRPTAAPAQMSASVKAEPGLAPMRREPRPAGMEAYERQGLHHSQSQPVLSAAESAKRAPKLSLKDYQQRVEARPGPVKQEPLAPQPQSRGGHSQQSHHHPAQTHPSLQPTHPHHHHQQQQPHGHSQHSQPLLHQDIHHPSSQLHPSKTSPMKMIKKEGVTSSVPENVHLKEAKVMVQDLRDSHGQERVMYANAEASRKRSISQSSREEEGEVVLTPTHNPQASHSHHYRHSSRGGGEQQRGSHGSKHHSGKSSSSSGGEGGEKITPLKLTFKRDSGGLQVRNPSQDVAQSSSKSSPLKVKIRRNPDTATIHEVAPPAAVEQKDQGIKLRLQVPSPGSSGRGGGHEKHSHHHNAYSNGSHDRKHKHSSRSHTQLPGGQSVQYQGQGQGMEKALQRSASTTQVVHPNPPASDSGIVFGSSHQPFQQQRKQQSSRPSLKTQHSGFSFPDHLIDSNLPDMIFEPDTPTEVNGGSFEAPATPTPENMNRVNAQMQQMYAQTKAHQAGGRHYPPPHHVHPHQMYMYAPPPQPPLPPPLPAIPPPQPPPPPQ
ncbi:hypothetical protein V1264_008457 [Littorina saxatilis]|uniref:Cyclin-like domain-containing protein n=1 Tax=Littorina saxatilis TaxID=31220 RepID=A0AAN9G2B3_9CAEN